MFKKKLENFVCEKCGTEVVGDGFTNHCPHCLWSKHVDNDPGDREASCKGLMEPIEVLSTREGEIILHRCVVCGKEKKNKKAKNDSFDTLLSISVKNANKFSGV